MEPRTPTAPTAAPAPRRSRSRQRRRVLAAAVALVVGVVAGPLTSGVADASVVARSGAYGDVRGHCVTYSSTGTTTMSLDITNRGFEYVAFYFRYPDGTGGWTDWLTYGAQTATAGQRVPTGTAIYARFADRLAAGQWEFASQWTVFADGSYYCR